MSGTVARDRAMDCGGVVTVSLVAAGFREDLQVNPGVVELGGRRVHCLADSRVAARVDAFPEPLVIVALSELGQGLRGSYWVVLDGISNASKSTGKAVIEVMIISDTGDPVVVTCSSVVA